MIDNDLTGENAKVVKHIRMETAQEVSLFEEPTPGIPAARNASVRAALQENADGLIFVDDDEEAAEGWLAAMLDLWQGTNADIITGPVHAHLPSDAPYWAKASRAFEKDKALPRGEKMRIAYTNNTLVSKKVLAKLGASFDHRFQYTGSSDLHYFLCAVKAGFEIIWCPDALMVEYVPLSRTRFGWILKRGFRSGSGETRAYIFINGLREAIPGILYRAAARIGLGLVQLIGFPLTGWNGVIVGSRRVSSGIGGLMGLFGVGHQEYRKIHS